MKKVNLEISSAEHVIRTTNPTLKGKKFQFDPKDKDYVYVEEDGIKTKILLQGEVKKPETIDFNTLKPIEDGLFSEKIFGSLKGNKCVNKITTSNGEYQVCDRSTADKMGYIALTTPIIHTWYLMGTNTRLSILLDLKQNIIDDLLIHKIYFSPLLDEMIDRKTYQEQKQKYASYITGIDVINMLLKKLNLKEEKEKIEIELKTRPCDYLITRLEEIETLIKTNASPEWIVMDLIPVLPTWTRPIIYVKEQVIDSPLNDLYCRIITYNERIKRLKNCDDPELILINEKRMLQKAVNDLYQELRSNDIYNSYIL